MHADLRRFLTQPGVGAKTSPHRARAGPDGLACLTTHVLLPAEAGLGHVAERSSVASQSPLSAGCSGCTAPASTALVPPKGFRSPAACCP